MVLVSAVGSESRFAAYVEGLASVIGHKDRVGPLRDYCTGLMLPCARKPHAPEWLLIEWPKGEAEPTKYWLSTLPDTIAFDRLVDIAKLRWRIERDYQELKQEVGLGHFEGRGWRGFHHHATLCIAAYSFLISERETILPKGIRPRFQADSALHLAWQMRLAQRLGSRRWSQATPILRLGARAQPLQSRLRQPMAQALSGDTGADHPIDRCVDAPNATGRDRATGRPKV